MATYTYTKALVDIDALVRESLDEELPSPQSVNWSAATQQLILTYPSSLTTEEKNTLDTVVSAHTGNPYTYPENDIERYLKRGVTTTDPRTGISGPFDTIQNLVNRRELFNDAENPLYIEDFTPILGPTGWAEQHANRINNLETIHGKMGWHNQEVQKGLYARPRDLLIYYGWLNSFNSAVNQWNNEKVAQDMAKHGLIVFGDGVQDPAHGDYANSQIIIPRIKALNPSTLIFGYVSTNQTLSSFQAKVDQWNMLGVHGIFMDESGYDYGKTRSEFNERVDYVHGKTSANLAFANAWNADHVLGTTNDPSYPNSTYNPSSTESKLTANDWILLESFGVNTSAYTLPGQGGYEPKSQWAARGVKANGLRAVYGVNFAAVGIINNDNPSGSALFNFGFISSLMWSLEGWGTSDTSYGANSAAVSWWTRPDVSKMGAVWTLSPSVQADVNDSDVYVRFVPNAKMSLDFSSGAQASSITKH